MSAAMMSNNLNRRFLTPPAVAPPPHHNNNNNKRKERDSSFDAVKPSAKQLIRPNIPKPGSPRLAQNPAEPGTSNQLMAGYLAHEFLTMGTLFGEPWDPARAEALPVAESRRNKPLAEKAEPEGEEEKKQRRYAEVVDLLKSDGAHFPGIVNPTQLGRYLQL